MSKLDEIYLGVQSRDIAESKFNREIKNVMLSLISKDIKLDGDKFTETAIVGALNDYQYDLRKKVEEL